MGSRAYLGTIGEVLQQVHSYSTSSISLTSFMTSSSLHKGDEHCISALHQSVACVIAYLGLLVLKLCHLSMQWDCHTAIVLAGARKSITYPVTLMVANPFLEYLYDILVF